MRHNCLFVLILALLFASCRKDEIRITDGTITLGETEVIGKGGVYGIIVDEDGLALASAQVNVQGTIVQSDENGLFQVRNNDVTLNAAGTPIKVEKPGFFQGSARIFPQNESQNFVKIRLLPIQSIGVIDANTGGTINFEGAQLTLRANSVVDEASGAPYTGQVNVAAHWIDPTSSILNEVMPGDLLGIDAENNLVGMATFGMVAVELMDDAGNKLQVAAGQKAGLSFPVPASLQADAPASIPLWSFDETNLLWIEEGSAELQDGRYIGEVTHFSFWNCDAPFPLVMLDGQLLTANGGPAMNRSVRLTVVNSGIVRHGYSNMDGNFGGKVPKDETMVLEVLDYCGDVVYSQNIGPYSNNVDLGAITIPAQPDAMTVTGQLQDCDFNALAEGAVRVDWNNQTLWGLSADDGSFSFEFNACELAGSNVSIQAYDTENSQESFVSSYSAATTVDAGTIVVCDQAIDQYINITLDGESYTMLDPSYEIINDSFPTGDFLYLTGVAPIADDITLEGGFRIGGTGTGMYTDAELGANFFERNLTNPNLFISYGCAFQQGQQECDDLILHVTATGGSGDYIEGNFNGTIDRSENQVLTTIPISGTFRVLIP